MAEKLGGNGPLGDCRAVERQELGVLAAAVLVDDARYVVLSYTAFPGHEDGEVGGGYGNCRFKRTVQRGVITDDVVAVLKCL